MTNKYKKYLKSADWLLKRVEFIKEYKKNGWKIACLYCESTDNINFHHRNYKNLYKKEHWDIEIVCQDCHKKLHKDKNFEKKWLINELGGGIKTYNEFFI